MPLGAALGSISLLLQNMNVKKPTVHVLKGKSPDKPIVFPQGKEIKALKRGAPEDHGYKKEYIESFLNELSRDLSIRPNRVLVIKGDEVIGERYAHPYVPDAWDCVFSATKTVTALTLGALYDEGKVDLHEPVCKILGVTNKVGNLQNRKITLKHLLTMSTGNAFNELESAASKRWIKDYFDSLNKFPIGSKFEYNSLNTFIIGACVEKLAGRPLSEYAKEKIFDPLDMNEVFFETSPEGIAKSGWGLYILPEDMAKLGVMVRDNGVYRGKRILSEDWIGQMTKKRISSKKYGHRFDYGYQTWVDEEKNFCCFNGMYNQDILMYRNSGVAVVLCCANNEAFHGSNLYPIAEKYFMNETPGDFALVETPGDHDYKNADDLLYYYDDIVDKEYRPVDKKGNSCGILPLLIQNEMGTYAAGVKKMVFRKAEKGYSLELTEGETEHILRFDFGEGVRQTFDLYGNRYDCAVDARFLRNGKGDPFLIVRVFFLEFASSRYFSFKFGKTPDYLSVEASENPGLDFIGALLEAQDKATKSLIRGVMKIVDVDVVETKAKNIFSPTFVLSSLLATKADK